MVLGGALRRTATAQCAVPLSIRRLRRAPVRWPAVRTRATLDQKSCAQSISQRSRWWDGPTRHGQGVLRTDPVLLRFPRRRPSAKWICRRANGSPSRFLRVPCYPLNVLPGSAWREFTDREGRGCHARLQTGEGIRRIRTRGSNPAGCRCGHRSASRRGGRSGPPCRWPATAGSRARVRARPSAIRR